MIACGVAVVALVVAAVVSFGPDEAVAHKRAYSHVHACAALQGAPCQAKLKFRFVGGGAAVIYGSVGGGAAVAYQRR